MNEAIDAATLRHQFLAWQCLIRQYAIRNAAGRPPQGGLSAFKVNGSEVWQEPIVILTSKLDSAAITAQFRFAAKQTHDPNLRRETALKHLAAAYYQQAATFSDQLTALYPFNSPIVRQVIAAGGVTLRFSQANQQYIMPCTVRRTATSEPLYQFTYWHNFLFNASMPGKVDIVCFAPDWQAAMFTKLF